MSDLFDPGQDFPQLIDHTETVTLRRTGSGATASVAGALRRGLTEREAAASGGRLTTSDVRWHLAVASLNDPPALGDQILDAAGSRWTVLEIRYAAAGSRWLAIARNLAVVHGLAERIDIERATWTKDAAGAARPTWHVVRSGLRARIQLHDAIAASAEGRAQFEATHRVLLAEPVEVDQSHRVIGPDGRIYRVVGYQGAEHLAAPCVIEAVAGGTLDGRTSTHGEPGGP